jgi:hypothetical protein
MAFSLTRAPWLHVALVQLAATATGDISSVVPRAEVPRLQHNATVRPQHLSLWYNITLAMNKTRLDAPRRLQLALPDGAACKDSELQDSVGELYLVCCPRGAATCPNGRPNSCLPGCALVLSGIRAGPCATSFSRLMDRTLAGMAEALWDSCLRVPLADLTSVAKQRCSNVSCRRLAQWANILLAPAYMIVLHCIHAMFVHATPATLVLMQTEINVAGIDLRRNRLA